MHKIKYNDVSFIPSADCSCYEECIEDAYEKGRADEQDRILSIVSRCIAHNVYNVSEGIALLNEIKEELKGSEE